MKTKGRRQSTNVQERNPTDGYANSFAGKMGDKKVIERYYKNSAGEGVDRSNPLSKATGANNMDSVQFRDDMKERSRADKMHNENFNRKMDEDLKGTEASRAKTSRRPQPTGDYEFFKHTEKDLK